MPETPIPPRTCLLLPIILVIAACAAPGPDADRQSSAGEARSAYLAGDYGTAAIEFQELALSQPEVADYWWFRAADAAWLAGDARRAGDFLKRSQLDRLEADDRPLARLLEVATARPPMSPIRALANLDYPPERLPEAYRGLYLKTRGQVLAAADQPYASAVERLRLADELLDPELARQNRLAVLEALQQLSVQELTRLLRRHDPEEEIYGWMALVSSAKQAVFSSQPIRAAVDAWRERFPDHPANLEAADALISSYDVSFSSPRRIALILPLSGNLASAGQSMLDGFMTAYYSGDRTGQIQVYDSQSEPSVALAMYRRAIAERVSAVVGPLDKDAVAAVILEADGSVPLLALNYPTRPVPALPGIFQFGLLPEDDARATAERMLSDGHARALVLKPNSSWGDRMGQAFVDRFEALGGVVQDVTAYAEDSVDFSPLIERVVGLDRAQQRRRELQGQLGIPLGFVPQMRPDVDALFMAARPREGRLIKPQLAFHNAGSLPVYATSHVYTGIADPIANRDLNEVRFCDAPLLLGSQSFQLDADMLRETFESASGSRLRLFAIGYDAFRILPYLDWLSGLSGDGFPGTTGQLVVNRDGQIKRRLDCAEIRSGGPRPLENNRERAGP
ncbi:MAG: penicillin-binding protein activator [Xanthomonadales bacterium]|nr:penicillin-binding protein activator [Xanthomonadales bacterium]